MILKKESKMVAKTGDLKQIFDFAEKHSQDADFIVLTKAVIKSGDMEAIIKFAELYPQADIAKIENFIIKSKDVKSMVSFATKVKVANIEIMQATLLKHGTINDLIAFAKMLPNIYFRDIEDYIIANGTPSEICEFAEQVKSVVVKKLEDAVIKSGSVEDILRFAKNVEGADAFKLGGVVMDLYDSLYTSNPDGTYNHPDISLLHELEEFSNIDGADFDNIEIRVLARNDIGEICKYVEKTKKINAQVIINNIVKHIPDCAKDVLNFVKSNGISKVEFFEDLFIRLGDIDALIDFAKDTPGVHLWKIEDKIIETKNVQNMYCLARKVLGVDVERLQKEIIKICRQSKKYTDEFRSWDILASFARFVYGADIEKIQSEILNCGNSSAIFSFAHVKGVDTEKLQQALIETHNATDLIQFALFIPNANFDLLMTEAMKEKSVHFAGILYTCADKPNLLVAPLDKIEDAMIKSGNVTYIAKLAEIDGYNKEKLLAAADKLKVLKPDDDGGVGV